MSEDFSILIVEDDDDARANLEDILSLDGYEVRTETNCLQAINAVETSSFDTVLVDWRLPDGSADQLIPVIVEHQPQTPVIVVTGMRDFDTAVTALRSGAYDFLLKPINPDALRAILKRIGERKKYLGDLADAQEKLLVNERLAAIGQMVAGLAHESRNAFQRSHACLAELELDLEDQPHSLELVRKVQKALDHLYYLLEEVRTYSAPIVLEKRRTDLKQLVTDTWQQIGEARPGRSLPDLDLEVEGEEPVWGAVDDQRLGQVIRNLLENAVFANEESGRIRVRLKPIGARRGRRLRLEVADEGPGVADSDQERIFHPFFTTKTKGTGLGLAVSRRFVEAHGGHIWVEAAVPQGARFVVELPIGQE